MLSNEDKERIAIKLLQKRNFAVLWEKRYSTSKSLRVFGQVSKTSTGYYEINPGNYGPIKSINGTLGNKRAPIYISFEELEEYTVKCIFNYEELLMYSVERGILHKIDADNLEKLAISIREYEGD